jgi:uncharacterized protein YraI
VKRLVLSTAILAVWLLIATAQAAPTVQAQPPTGGATNANANLRAGPGTTFDIVGRAEQGTPVVVAACNDDCSWYQLEGGEWIAAFLVDGEGVAAPAAATLPNGTPSAEVSLDDGPDFTVTVAAPTVPAAGPSTVATTIEDTGIEVASIDESTTDVTCAQAIGNPNLRGGPGTDYPIVGELQPGDCVTITGSNEAGDWYQLEGGEWVAAFLISGAPAASGIGLAAALATSTPVTPSVAGDADCPQAAGNPNLRGGPGTDYPIVGELQAGECVSVAGANEAGDWLQLEGGEWVAGFLIANAPAAGTLSVVDAPAVGELTPTPEAGPDTSGVLTPTVEPAPAESGAAQPPAAPVEEPADEPAEEAPTPVPLGPTSPPATPEPEEEDAP